MRRILSLFEVAYNAKVVYEHNAHKIGELNELSDELSVAPITVYRWLNGIVSGKYQRAFQASMLLMELDFSLKEINEILEKKFDEEPAFVKKRASSSTYNLEEVESLLGLEEEEVEEEILPKRGRGRPKTRKALPFKDAIRIFNYYDNKRRQGASMKDVYSHYKDIFPSVTYHDITDIINLRGDYESLLDWRDAPYFK